jgi:hypothetical protein
VHDLLLSMVSGPEDFLSTMQVKVLNPNIQILNPNPSDLPSTMQVQVANISLVDLADPTRVFLQAPTQVIPKP